MLLSAVSVLVVAHSSSEIPEGLMNSPVYFMHCVTLLHRTYAHIVGNFTLYIGQSRNVSQEIVRYIA